MKLYNTMSRSIEVLKPINPDAISFYSCGPTVYDYPHIGNWTGYIYWDVLVRVLKASGNNVTWFMNLTDVGHLVSDDDSGEDKLEKGAKREGKSAWDVAKFYTEDFISGLKALSIQIPFNHLVAATDNIPEQIALIKKLEEKGFTYTIDDGVYFDSTKVADYGKLARLDINGLEAGIRVAVTDKKHPTDFALWKFSPKNSIRDMEWDSPWGKGFPGWHIECSAMAMKYLGETIDIHAGGIDHIPVHHTNEIAQSESATGKTFVNYWIHNNHMTLGGEKLSKSAQNGVTLQTIYEHGFTAEAFRLLVLQSHYRTQSNFSWDNLRSASHRIERWQSIADLRWQDINSKTKTDLKSELNKIADSIIEALQNDIDTPLAIAEIEAAMDILLGQLSVKTVDDCMHILQTIRELLGIDLTSSRDLTDEQKQLLAQRSNARQKNDWNNSDSIRDQLHNQGIDIDDTASGQRWSRIKVT
jgi:cysteinyl-tRNA synthetase